MGSLPNRTKLGLELYMEGRVSLGKAAEVAGLPVTEFDYVRGRAKVPLRGPDDWHGCIQHNSHNLPCEGWKTGNSKGRL